MTQLVLGHVYTRRSRDPRGRPERGVLVCVGDRGIERPRGLFHTDYVLKQSPGIYSMFDHEPFARYCEPVPEEEWTGYERMLGAMARWEPPHWIPEGERWPDSDTWEWACIRALLRRAEVDRIFGEGDWPISMDELLFAVAEALDDRQHGDTTLARAMTRLGA